MACIHWLHIWNALGSSDSDSVAVLAVKSSLSVSFVLTECWPLSQVFLSPGLYLYDLTDTSVRLSNMKQGLIWG